MAWGSMPHYPKGAGGEAAPLLSELLLLYVVIYSLLGNSRLFFQKRHNKNVPYRDYRIHFFQVYAIYDKLR